MVFHGLLTKGRLIEARYETTDFNGNPEDRGFEQKCFNLTLRDIFLTYFSRSMKPIKYFAKMLRCCVAVQISSLMVFHCLLIKGGPLEARHETKEFNGKPVRPWI